MFKGKKLLIMLLVVLTVVVVIAGYAIQQKWEQMEREKNNTSQIQGASDQPAKENNVSEGRLYKAVYSVCKDDITTVFAYDIKSGKNTVIFTDEDKDYALDLSADSGKLESDVFTFMAEDRKTKEEAIVTFDLNSKLEKKVAYDISEETEKGIQTEKKGDYEVLTSTIKKSPNGRRLMFVTGDQNLYIADADYENAKKISDFTQIKCVNGGSTVIDYAGDWRGWLTDNKIFFDDSGFKCSGNGSFLIDVESGKVSKFSDPLVYVPAQTVQADDNFIAVVNSGNGNRIVIMNAESGDVVQEIDKGTYVIVAPDNSRMFYESHPGENIKIPGKLYVADANGGNKSEVSPGADGILHLFGWTR